MAKYDKIGKTSSEAVTKATGKTWDEWVELLDKEGAKAMSHKEIAQMLHDKKLIKKPSGWPAGRSFSEGWWSQMVTVGYEYAKGRRVLGETSQVGFEVGTQRILPINQKKLWDLVLSKKGLEVWLGKVKDFELKVGFHYKTADGTEGEVRTFKKGEKIRLTWKPKDWKKASTLQITLFCPRNTMDKTNLHFHHEKLASAKIRAQMRDKWKEALHKLGQIV